MPAVAFIISKIAYNFGDPFAIRASFASAGRGSLPLYIADIHVFIGMLYL